MPFKGLPSAVYVRTRLDYDPQTGVFIWRPKIGSDRFTKIWNSNYAGKRAGYLNDNGYRLICLDNIKYRASRLAYLIMTDEAPAYEIDHRISDPTNPTLRSDDRWENLRPATSSEQKVNIGLRKNNTSGYKGVSWHEEAQKWSAEIQFNREPHKLGLYATAEQAYAAYCKKARELHGDFIHDEVTSTVPTSNVIPVQLHLPLGVSGIRGVRQTDTGRWLAEGSKGDVTQYYGTHDTKQEAIEARRLGDLGIPYKRVKLVNGKSGIKGVYERPSGRWAAVYKRKNIDTFDTKEEAADAIKGYRCTLLPFLPIQVFQKWLTGRDGICSQ